jgi:hypothetical protein
MMINRAVSIFSRIGRPAGDHEFVKKIEKLTGRVLRRQKPGPKKKIMVNAFCFSQRKGMQAIVMIPSLERISTPSVEIKPGAACDDKPDDVFVFVVFALDKSFPLSELMNFVENQKIRIPRPYSCHNSLAIRPVVPIIIRGIFKGCANKISAQRRLADLARPAYKDHFLFQVIKNISC